MNVLNANFAAMFAAIAGTFAWSSAVAAKIEYTNGGDGKPLILFVPGFMGDKTSFTALGSAKSWLHLMAEDRASISGSNKPADYATAIVTYPSGCGSRHSIPQVADGVATDLYDQGIWAKHPFIIFVGHSTGGLIIQELLAVEHQKINGISLTDRTAGAIMLATPTSGSELASLASAFERMVVGASDCQPIHDMKSSDTRAYLRTLDDRWRNYLTLQEKQRGIKNRLQIRCFYETKPLSRAGIIVPLPWSATHCDGGRTPISANHIDIAKPESQTSEVYHRVRNSIAEIEWRTRWPNASDSALSTAPPASEIIPPVPRKISGIIEKITGIHVEGKGYRTYHSTSYAVCTVYCINDDMCHMIKHSKADDTCQLYQHSRIDGRASNADVGLKKNGIAGYPLENMIKKPGTYIDGKGYRTVINSTVEQCLDLCGKDRACRASEHYANDNMECNLYTEQKVRAGGDRRATVAIKPN